MKLANRTSRIAPSPTLRLTATAKAMVQQGIDVIDFSLGEPDFDSPSSAKAEAESAIQAGFTKYTASSGMEELRVAIADSLYRDHRLRYTPAQILVSCGAKHSLYNLAQAMFEEGDEVIIPTPYWASYRDQILLTDATPVFLTSHEKEGYAINPSGLLKTITKRTKAIILNSPCNPTGAIYPKPMLEAIAQIAVDHNLLIISDEIYEKILYDGHQHTSIASLGPDVAERTVVINGVSKSYAMTGWRIGYAAGPQFIISAMGNIQSQSTSNPSSISQKAALEAISHCQTFTQQMVKEFDTRRRVMVDRLNAMPGIRCPLPAGAFYAFPNVEGLYQRKHEKGVIGSASDLSAYLLDAARIATVPGEPFGLSTHLRLSYATSLEAIEQGLDRMEKAVRTLQ